MTKGSANETFTLPSPTSNSSAGLKTQVAVFMDRAEEVRSHPLAGTLGKLKFVLEFDPETLQMLGGTATLDDLDRSSWVYLAVLMRPVVFLEQEPVSLHVITNAISREHEPLRPLIKNFKTRYTAWQKSNLLGIAELEPPAVPLPAGEHQIESIWTGEVGTLPNDIDEAAIVWDRPLADTFLNGCVWHSDIAKAATYNAASPLQKQIMAKCAELRTLSAVEFIVGTRAFILAARNADYDF
jgi:hypothetical protein